MAHISEITKTNIQLTGHQTFTLRYGWLRKVYDSIENKNNKSPLTIFKGEDAIARFGVGKNMVSSIRYWSNACEIIKEYKEGLLLTNFGRFIFESYDEYIEKTDTLWLLHWNIASSVNSTFTAHWTFNHFNRLTFSREQLEDSILELCRRLGVRATSRTIKNDVSCTIRLYCPKELEKNQTQEDLLESPLVELGLITQQGVRYKIHRDDKKSLSNAVFTYAVIDFFERYNSTSSTLSIDNFLFESGSPMLVFALDENSMIDRLREIANYTDGAYQYSEGSGMRQIIRKRKFNKYTVF